MSKVNNMDIDMTWMQELDREMFEDENSGEWWRARPGIVSLAKVNWIEGDE